jgi:hypothetical protein
MPPELEQALKNVDASTVALLPLVTPEAAEEAVRTMQAGAVDGYLQGAIDTGNTQLARSILDSGRFDGALGANGLKRNYDAIEAEEKRQEAERKVVMSERKVALGARHDDAVAEARNTGDTTIAPAREDYLAVGLTPEEADEAVMQVTKAQSFGKTKLALSNMSQQEVMQAISFYTPEGENYEAEARDYAELVTAMQSLEAEKAKDPAAYVAKYSPQAQGAMTAAQDAVTAWRSNPKRPPPTALFERAAQVSEDEQIRLGVPSHSVRTLTVAQAAEIVTQTKSKQGPDLVGHVAGMKLLYGAYWPEVQRELKEAGMPDLVTEMVAISQNPSHGPAVEMLSSFCCCKYRRKI